MVLGYVHRCVLYSLSVGTVLDMELFSYEPHRFVIFTKASGERPDGVHCTESSERAIGVFMVPVWCLSVTADP